jgi:DNA (cytosine-5)-methyltransferase 1
MARALGWDGLPGEYRQNFSNNRGQEPRPISEPAPTMAFGHMLPHFRVGFPRVDDLGDSEDGYRERDWRYEDEPAHALTEKARSWVVQTGANTMTTSREKAGSKAGDPGVELYERPIDEPAPTVDAKTGGAWKVIALNTGKDWKPGGTRDDAQTIPVTEPAPTLAAGHGGASKSWWKLVEEGVWDEDRPATTLAGDARVFAPGGHIANDGRDNAAMIGRSEHTIRLGIADALVLQSFRPDYPVQGTRTKQFEQVGNAVPPVLAAAILRTLVG